MPILLHDRHLNRLKISRATISQRKDPVTKCSLASVGLMWSLGLACKDIFALRNKKDLHTPDNLFIIVMVDWVVATFMFSGACASASLTIFFMWDVNFCETYSKLACRQFVLSVVLAFITWLLQAASSFSAFWLLVSFS
ncbi:unnamed protein product [Triticum turgidum subsp. durum]|uniref:CASP-like protein n=1 Tax=Triticum turgidum subsp. durum TaxID=4567 RepID=A0A9R0RXH9_TRITD|nr:unnamed protein product [Triticum turgidum subsp. durum]